MSRTIQQRVHPALAIVRRLIIFGFVFSLVSLSSAEVTLDGSLGPAGPVKGPDYLIPDRLGRRSGVNLFHSFSHFNIAAGESATFSNSGAPLENIIARVTGGASTIDGLLRSTIAGADFFLLNPAGVIFGPNARLDVPAGFHVSTADYIGFGNEEKFYADPATDSVLSVAPPEAFGFLGPNPASITLDRSILKVEPGQTLALVGGDLSARNDPDAPEYFDWENYNYGPNFYLLNAPGGVINLIAVAGPGEVSLDHPDLGAFAQSGRISFTNGANLTVSTDYDATGPAGTIVIRGGEILFQDGGISGIVGGIEACGNPAGSVDIAGETLQLDNASITALNIGDDHQGDVVKIDLSGDFLMTNGSLIDSSSMWGDAGRIAIEADRIILGDDDPGTSLYRDSGFYGYIISQSQFGSEGRGGDIFLGARKILVQNGFAVITASTEGYPDYGIFPGFGDAGDITVRATSLEIRNKAQIVSNSFGAGNGGTVDVAADEVLISDKDRNEVINYVTMAGLSSQTIDANGGRVKVEADSLTLEDGGRIGTEIFGDGTGADVVIDVGTLKVSGFVPDESLLIPYMLSAIDARVFDTGATGTGGSIAITADHIRLDNGGAIRTGLYNSAPGKAGDITITAGNIEIASLGQIYADSFRGSGDSGDIDISARNLTITGIGDTPPPEPFDFDFTGISTTTDQGQGGTISADIENHLALILKGGIRANTLGVGTGGDIELSAADFNLNRGGIINSSSSGTGNAGSIGLKAVGELSLDHAAITTEASTDADGGNIAITAGDLLHLYYSKITSSVGGGPETTGGNITIDPDYVILNHSRIVANAYAGTGGNIDIVANTFLADPQSRIDASSQLGVSGTVDIRAPVTSISGLVTPLNTEFVRAAELLKGRCLARLREGGTYSSFIVGGRDGLPFEPGGLLPGTY
ncbi:MAG: filamentous hemagglutinin N-terminal domain-containing protein [Deltaproteobacteria bacterium]|nr:filamentous hemagglutinin N-terminal domain-containing protein [Deltaproteobacteria bacterium]